MVGNDKMLDQGSSSNPSSIVIVVSTANEETERAKCRPPLSAVKVVSGLYTIVIHWGVNNRKALYLAFLVPHFMKLKVSFCCRVVISLWHTHFLSP